MEIDRAKIFPINLVGRPQAVVRHEFSRHPGLVSVILSPECYVMHRAAAELPG